MQEQRCDQNTCSLAESLHKRSAATFEDAREQLGSDLFVLRLWYLFQPSERGTTHPPTHARTGSSWNARGCKHTFNPEPWTPDVASESDGQRLVQGELAPHAPTPKNKNSIWDSPAQSKDTPGKSPCWQLGSAWSGIPPSWCCSSTWHPQNVPKPSIWLRPQEKNASSDELLKQNNNKNQGKAIIPNKMEDTDNEGFDAADHHHMANKRHTIFP